MYIKVNDCLMYMKIHNNPSRKDTNFGNEMEQFPYTMRFAGSPFRMQIKG